MVAINPNNYPNSALAASAPPAAPATTPTPAATPDATQPSAEEAPATGEAVDTPEAAAAKPATADSSTPATPDLVISKDMAEALSSDQIQKLIKGILADGTVDKLDDAQLKQLNILLTAAAKKDGKVSGEEDSLIDALDSRGMFGTNREVVKANLQALRKHEGEANTLNFGDGSIQVTTQDGVSGFFGGKQTRGLRMEMVDLDSSTPATNTTPTGETPNTTETPAASTPNTPSPATTATSPDVDSPTAVTPPVDPEKALSTEARQTYHEQTVAQNSANEAQLKEDLNYLKSAFSKVPDEIIKQDIQSLVEHSDSEGYDMAYVKNQLQSWNISLPEALKDSTSPEDLKAFLSEYEVSADNIQAYRSSINGIIDKATNESPLTGTALSDAKKFLYDTNYIFENKANVPEEDYQRYSQFKTSLLNYQDSEARVKNIARNENISTTNIELDNQLLGNYTKKATTEIQDLAQNVNNFLKQVESKNAGNEEVQALRSQLGEIVEVDAKGQLIMDAEGKPQVKQPISEEHLQSLNKIWASVEAVGMQNGLDRESGEITQDFFNELRSKTEAGNPKAIEQWNTIQESPAGEILAAKPEIAQYADLLKVLDDPKNAALKEALFSSDNPEQAVNELLAKHNSAVFNDMFGSFGSLWNVGPASYLTAWGCSVVPGAADTAFCQAITGPSTNLLDQPLPGSLPDYTLSLNNTTAKASFGLDLETPALSLNTPMSTDGKLALGKYSTEDVRHLLDLLKDPPAIEGQEEATAQARATQQMLRGQLKEHSGDIAGFINDTPELEGLRQQLEAKEAFDNAFWGDNSDMDQARQSVKTLLSKQDRVGSDLAVAEAQIQAVLETLPEGPGSLRTSLENKLAVVRQAQTELKNSGQISSSAEVNNNQTTLQSVMNSLNGKGIASDGNTHSIGQNLIADTQVEQLQGTIDNALKTLAEINGDPTKKQAVLDKFPEAQRDQISNLLNNHKLLGDIRQQLSADPAALDPSTLQAFAFAGYMTDLAQNGTPDQIKAALEGQLPGSSLKVSDAIEHMDRLFKHVDTVGFEDPKLKATYISGLNTYFNEVFESGQSVEQAWAALEDEDMLKTVQAGIIRKVYDDAGMSSEEIDHLFASGTIATQAPTSNYENLLAEKSSFINDFLSDQQNTLQGFVQRGGQTQSPYESLLYEYTNLEKQRNPQKEGTDPNYNKNAYLGLETRVEDRIKVLTQRQQVGIELSSTEQRELTNLQRLQEATRASMETENLKVLEINGASSLSSANTLFSVLNRTTQGVIDTTRESEILVDDQSNQQLFNQFVPTVNLPNGQPISGRAFVAQMLGEGGATAENVGIFEANFGALKETREGQLLYQQTLSQARSNEYAQLSHHLVTSNSEDPNNPSIFAFGESLKVGNVEVNKLISGPNGLEALEEWNRIIQKHGESLKSGNGFDQEAYSRDLQAFASRFGITNEAFLGYAQGTSFQNDVEELETAQHERKSLSPEESIAVDEEIERSNTDIAYAMAAVSSPEVTVDLSQTEGFDPDAFSGFNESVQKARQNMERSSTERLDGLLAVEDAINRDTARIISEAKESGDYSLLNQVQQLQSQALQGDLERSDAMREALSELTGKPFVPRSDSYRAAAGLSTGGTAAEQKAAALVEEANALASRLSLAPEGPNSDEFLSDLISGFIDTIRDQDYKTRQLIMAQLANQMMTDSITTFYKDKTDKNNKYHQDAIERMANSMQQMIQRTLQDSLLNAASDGQGIAALSGQVGAANTAEAMGLEQLRQSTEELLSETQKMEPPLITDLQKERLLQTLFDKNPDNDMLGILTLAGAVN